jgi:putative addiction module CopG family antidote
MTVNIGEHFEKMLEDMLAGGRFQNQSEVIRAGLRLLEDREYGQDDALENELLKRLNSRSTPWAKSDLAEIRKLGRAKLKKRAGFEKAA